MSGPHPSGASQWSSGDLWYREHEEISVVFVI